MRGRMVEAGSFTSFGVDSEPNSVSRLDCPADHPASMHNQRRLRFLRVEDFHHVPTRGLHPAKIADLTARLAVERSFGGDDFDFLTFTPGARAGFSLDQRSQDLRFPFDNAVADKARAQIGQSGAEVNRALLPLASTGALFFHRPLEPRPIHTESFRS